VRELNNKRPLLPPQKSFKDENSRVHEVLETFRMIAAIGPDYLGAYVISMARAASDVLAVELLQKEARRPGTELKHIKRRYRSRVRRCRSGAPFVQAGATTHLRVVPLFETKPDLENAGKTIKALLDIDWYHKVCRSPSFG